MNVVDLYGRVLGRSYLESVDASGEPISEYENAHFKLAWLISEIEDEGLAYKIADMVVVVKELAVSYTSGELRYDGGGLSEEFLRALLGEYGE